MCRFTPLFSLLLAALPASPQVLPTLSLTPSTLSFTYQIGAATLPAAQTIQVKRSGSGAALDFTTSLSPAAPWLIVTPTTGKTGTSISLRVNPTSLNAGTYSTTLQVDATGSAGPVTASITLIVKNPPPTMTAAPASLAFGWQTDSSSPPAAQTISVSTTGEPLSFTAAVASATWLSITPTVGVVLSGSPLTLAVSVDTTGLVPATYTSRITLTSLTASNKTVTIPVTLTVDPGTAVISSIWPSSAPIGSNDTTITIRGSHLFKASTVKAGATDLTATWISAGAMLAVIPKAMLTTQGSLSITVLNSPRPASNAAAFTVTPPGPSIQGIVNAASFAGLSPKPQLAPGEIISIFGSALGPSSAIVAVPTGNAFPTSLGTPPTIVEFEVNSLWVPAPLIFTQANQVNCQVPFSIPTGTDLKMRVTYNALISADFLYDGVATDPGIFTVDSSGRGQAAALNYDPNTTTYSLNSASNPAAKGGVLVLFLTGGGAITPVPNPDGQLTPLTPLPTLTGTPSVTIGGDAATVTSATAVPGALGGLAQLNVSVPSSLKAGKDHLVVVVIGGQASPVTATVAVK
ncbi:MAG: hypothetical protein IT167_11995 [Bryobacterales bacterium]|nr:hypothetical protein [Bryobacterales bacterium]